MVGVVVQVYVDYLRVNESIRCGKVLHHCCSTERTSGSTYSQCVLLYGYIVVLLKDSEFLFFDNSFVLILESQMVCKGLQFSLTEVSLNLVVMFGVP